VRDLEWTVLSTGDAGIEAPSPRGSEAHGTEEYLGLGAMRSRPRRNVGSLRPNPPSRTFAEPTGPSSEDAGKPVDRVDEGPHIVIGRINVDVVPPPATQASAAAPRPGPLTAASVSVIGSLGGGIRPNLRLSLRHR
jgi:hypothetical protein